MAPDTREYIPFAAQFLDQPVNPVLESSSSTSNYIVGGNGRQLNIGNLSTTYTTPYLPDYGLLDVNTIETIRCHTYQLLVNVKDASRRCHSLTASSSSPIKPARTFVHNPRDHCDTMKNIITILGDCDQLIHSFLHLIAPKSITVQNLRQRLQKQLESLILLLSRDQRSRGEAVNSAQIQHCFQQIDTVVVELLFCLSLYSIKTTPRQILHGSLLVVDQPIILSDPSRVGSRIPIPLDLCTSNQKLHNLLRIIFRNQPWHPKVDQEEYVLEDKELTTVIGTENWHKTVVPGAVILMTMVFKREAPISDSSCPSCRAKNIKRRAQGKRTECLNCKLIFDVVETDHVVEPPDDYTDFPTKARSLRSAENFNEALFSRIRYIRYTRGSLNEQLHNQLYEQYLMLEMQSNTLRSQLAAQARQVHAAQMHAAQARQAVAQNEYVGYYVKESPRGRLGLQDYSFPQIPSYNELAQRRRRVPPEITQQSLNAALRRVSRSPSPLGGHVRSYSTGVTPSSGSKTQREDGIDST